MSLIQILYILSLIVAMVVCVPQIKQLLLTKRSDELSLRSWTTWVFTQAIALLYSVSLGDFVLVSASFMWLSFYVCMALLIIHYRRPAIMQLDAQENEV